MTAETIAFYVAGALLCLACGMFLQIAIQIRNARRRREDWTSKYGDPICEDID